MSNRIDILEFNGDNYQKLMSFESWRVAMINYGNRVEKENLYRMERHMLTDEAFILLDGEATLIIGDNEDKYPMEKNKVYNINRAEWHAIYVSTDAKVLIVENENTGIENTEYRPLKGKIE